MEVIDAIILTLAIGFIFKDSFKIQTDYTDDPVAYYSSSKLFYEGFITAIIITAPAIILHEMGHKFVALYFGMQATFHASYTWLGIAVVLKLINPAFIFLVPAFVSWGCLTSICASNLTAMPFIPALIAFAGPGINLFLWVLPSVLPKFIKIPHKYLAYLYLSAKINMFLFIFNMLPIPGFDGFHFFSVLLSYFF